MINIQLLLMVTFYLVSTIVSAEQPIISINQTISDDTIWAKNSGQNPDKSTVILTINGSSNVSRKNRTYAVAPPANE